MRSIDTNVLVRALVQDVPAQTQRALTLLKSHPAYVPVTVVLELEWVLRSRYKMEKLAVLQTFNALLETQELEFQSEAAIERALHLYRQGSAEFADCLHAGISAAGGHSPLLTFDQKAGKLAGAKLL